MNIGKAAKLSNLTIKAVRYYANIGLVKPQQNISTGYRNYTDEEVAKLKFIGKARKFDFSTFNHIKSKEYVKKISF